MELKNFRHLFTTMSEKKTIATVATLVHGWAAPRPRTSLGPDVAPAPTWGICNNNNNNDLYAESGQTLQGSFSAVSKQASKQACTFRPFQEKRKETQVSARN